MRHLTSMGCWYDDHHAVTQRPGMVQSDWRMNVKEKSLDENWIVHMTLTWNIGFEEPRAGLGSCLIPSVGIRRLDQTAKVIASRA